MSSTKLQVRRSRPSNARTADHASGAGGPGGPVLWCARAGILCGAVVVWHFVTKLGLIDSVLAKGPADVWGFLKESSASGELWDATFATLYAVAIAFVLSGVVGVVAGLMLGLAPRVEWVLSPFLDALNAMPRVALAPIFIIYFGVSTAAKVALAFGIVVFIVMFSTRAAVQTVDHEILRLSRVLGAKWRDLFFQVLLPSAVPGIFNGLRLGLVYSLLGVVTSELLAARVGLGEMISRYSSLFRLEGVYGVLIVLALVAAVLNAGMTAAERYLLRWQAPTRS